MDVLISCDGLDLDAEIQEIVEERFSSKLVKYLVNFDDDLKKGSLFIKKRSRWGYKVKFDMVLPGKHGIFA
jgi:hypothetical protein